jgi:protein-tyrosine phosphatase
MTMENAKLLAVRNFAEVHPGLYRGAQPVDDFEYQWLRETFGVNAIVNLRAEAPTLDNDKGISLVTLAVVDDKAPTFEQADIFVRTITNGSTFYHCAHGHGRTSTFTVIARLHEGWTLEAAMREERDRFGYAFKNFSQIDFLSSYAQRMKGLAA